MTDETSPTGRIRKLRRRILKILAWAAALFAAFALAVTLLALYTPLPDRIAHHYLQKALSESGATLVIRSQSGAIVRGLDLRGVELDVPGQARFAAEHIHLQLRVVPLVAGVIVLRDTLAEEPHLILEAKGPQGTPSKGGELPLWLNLSARGCTVRGGHLEIRSGGETIQEWRDIASRVDVAIRTGDVSFRLTSLEASAPKPFPDKLRASGLVTLRPGERLGLDVKVESPRSSLTVKGSLGLKRGKQDYRARVGFSPVFLPEAAIGWSGAPALSASGSGQVSGNFESLTWKASLKADGLGPVATEGKASFSKNGGSVSGTASTDGAYLAPFWQAPKGREAHVSGKGTWRAEWTAGRPARWSATAGASRSQIWGLAVDSATVEASGSGQTVEVSGRAVSPASGPIEGRLVWGGERRAWNAHLAGASVPLPALLSKLDLGLALPEPLKYPEGVWNVESADLASDASGFQLKGAFQDPTGTRWQIALGPIAGGRPFDLSVKAAGLDPQTWNLGPHGRVTGEALFHGASFQAATVEGRFDSCEWAGLRFEPFAVKIHLTEKAFEFDPFELRAGGCKAKAGGSVGRDSSLDLGAEVFSPDVAGLKPVLGDYCPSGSLQFKGRISGHLLTPSVEGSALLTDLSFRSLSVTRLSVTGRWDGEGQTTDLTTAWEGLLAGKTNLGLGDVRLTGAPGAARVALFTDLGEQGRHLKLSAAGRYDLSHVDFEMEKVSLQADVLELDQEGKAHFSLDPEAIGWSGLTLVHQKSRVSLSGRLGLSGPFEKAPIAGALHAEHVPLKLLPLPPTAGVVGGHVNADLTWAGTIEAPVLSGEGGIEGGSYRFPDSDLTVTPIAVRFTAKDNNLVLTQATATTAEGGTATAMGHMAFKGFLPSTFGLTVIGKTFPFVIGRNVQGTTDFTLTFKGTLDKPVLEGSAAIVKGRILLPEIARQQPLPSSVRFINAPPGSRLAALAQGASPTVGNLRGVVHLKSTGNLWVSNRSLLAELAGDLSVRFTSEGPAISGALSLGNGRYLFQGKKFEILTSRISFSGTTELDPYVDLNAFYRAEGADIYVHIKGSADHPELHLTSSPPMDEGDILSVLLFGQKQTELNSSQSKGWSLAALSIAGRYQSSSFLGTLQTGLGLETLDVGTSAQGATEVGFSKYLTDKVVVEYRQTFGNVPEQRVNVRYRLNRHVSVQADSSTAGKSGTDVFWEQTY